MEQIYVRSFNAHYVLCIKSHNVMTSYESNGRMFELIDELILLCDSFEILGWT